MTVAPISTPAPLTVANLDLSIDPAEPRIRDMDLAERLGMRNPRHLRNLIKENASKLNAFGSLSAKTTMIEMGKGARREVTEYWLNEGQAVLLAIRSNAPRAAEVQVAVVRVYLDWRRGAAARLRDALLTARPRWGALARYRDMGLTQREMARLCNCSQRQVGRELAAMADAGLTAPDQAVTLS